MSRDQPDRGNIRTFIRDPGRGNVSACLCTQIHPDREYALRRVVQLGRGRGANDRCSRYERSSLLRSHPRTDEHHRTVCRFAGRVDWARPSFRFARQGLPPSRPGRDTYVPISDASALRCGGRDPRQGGTCRLASCGRHHEP